MVRIAEVELESAGPGSHSVPTRSGAGGARAGEGSPDDESVLTFKELNNVLRAWPNFGAFSIFMTHPLISCPDVVTKLLPLLLIIAQILLPLSLVMNAVNDFTCLDANGTAHAIPPADHEPMQMQQNFSSCAEMLLCPKVAAPQLRMIAAAIALVYVVRACTVFRGKWVELTSGEGERDSLPEDEAAEMRQRERSGVLQSPLNDYGRVDEFFAVSYEGLMMLLNLWLILTKSANVVDVVSNSLALQFVVSLTPEFKDAYFTYYGQAVVHIWRQRLHRRHSPLLLSCHRVDERTGRLVEPTTWAEVRAYSSYSGWRQRGMYALFLLWYVPEILVALALRPLVPLVCAVCVVYLPVCI
jgi:hypothetical protein